MVHEGVHGQLAGAHLQTVREPIQSSLAHGHGKTRAASTQGDQGGGASKESIGFINFGKPQGIYLSRTDPARLLKISSCSGINL